jgi:hypothetical protein
MIKNSILIRMWIGEQTIYISINIRKQKIHKEPQTI